MKVTFPFGSTIDTGDATCGCARCPVAIEAARQRDLFKAALEEIRDARVDPILGVFDTMHRLRVIAERALAGEA